MSLAPPNWAPSPGASQVDDFGSIMFWHSEKSVTRPGGVFPDEVELPPIEEVDAWAAVEDLEAGAAAWGGVPPWPEIRQAQSAEGGASRPLTVSLVAALLLFLAAIHSVGAIGSVSLGLARGGVGPALVAGLLALAIGVGEIVCAFQVSRGRSWARLVAAGLGALMLLWLTMGPWSPGALTVVVFAAWLMVGALLAHPLTSRFLTSGAVARAA